MLKISFGWLGISCTYVHEHMQIDAIASCQVDLYWLACSDALDSWNKAVNEHMQIDAINLANQIWHQLSWVLRSIVLTPHRPFLSIRLSNEHHD
jgi:hypothetical protein